MKTTLKICRQCKRKVKKLSTSKRCSRCVKSTKITCRRCGKSFTPSNIRQRNCLRCFKKGKSVWVTASAGSPGLGRRN